MEMWLAIAGFVLTGGTLLVTVTMQIAGIETRTKEFTQKIIKEVREEFYGENEKLRIEVSETIKPLKTLTTDYEKKHYELELYIRDNYIEIPTFQGALNDIKDLIKDVKDRVEKISDADTNWRKEVRSKN